MERTLNGEITAFPSPIAQCKKYKLHLQNWLKKMKLPSLPIEFLVVFTNSSSVLSASPHDTEVVHKVLRIENLLPRIQHLMNTFNTPFLEDKQLRRTSKLLLKEHRPYPINKYQTNYVKGIQCMSCKGFSMIRNRASWLCPRCGSYDKSAHVQAFNDYFLLMDPEISNQEARDFLHISSPRLAQYLLKSMSFVQSGSGRGATYSQSNF
ncbi:hypothetical protein ACQ0QQ_05540 [Lysinibacillus sphaericus]